MKLIEARNAHEALPKALTLLKREGFSRPSRNGGVQTVDGPVTTVYSHPQERVVFWKERDANPFFHLYESLWILAGRNDIAPLMRYAKNMANYSDDGVKQWAAYGYRMRREGMRDQLAIVARRLQKDPTDRRCVVQIWDHVLDLDRAGVDVPCNLTLTFQISHSGRLDMVVFNRSNDIIWGAYGANAVHFGAVHEYMSIWVGVPQGRYSQVSVNWHAYDDPLSKLADLAAQAQSAIFGVPQRIHDPYVNGDCYAAPMHLDTGNEAIVEVDNRIVELLLQVDMDFSFPSTFNDDNQFFLAAYHVLKAHRVWKSFPQEHRQLKAMHVLNQAPSQVDWVMAAKEWILRRP
ncbi:thy_syn_methano, thymidylate synthase, methanogen type [uncultured Caudovirales phage]|uniref:Thy_syn_methano, thymidylate synthase, methanogen type n=1 Tax=uncultured Caudovirales phage TaxID=2100421 RepID=A0A6J5R533_9CAUD|nr:thy_syn_methano, thymidylate synthase, methanogen type [uncultured Caudovirales phage]